MAIHRINVTIDGDHLVFAPDDLTHWIAHDELAVIYWVLGGRLARGRSFAPLDANFPGFEWLNPPPLSKFSPPIMQRNGRIIAMLNDNSDGNDIGRWCYRLRVAGDDMVYTTGHPAPDTTHAPASTETAPVAMMRAAMATDPRIEDL